jgi:hypothetical protein
VRSLLLIPLLCFLALAGCNSTPEAPLTPNAQAAQRALIDSVRTDLEAVPLPTKTKYMAIKSLETWANPYLTIQGSMVTLHVTIADANTSTLGQGSILRPIGARRQNLNVRTADLPAALNAIPREGAESAWPYGRVVALEEAHDAPKSAEPELRRNMETTIKILSDLGIVVYEWQDNNPALR